MPSKKPVPAVRRPPATASVVKSKPLGGRELEREIDERSRKYERPPGGEPEAPVGRGIVDMPGRRLKDGTRKGAKTARRMTFYLPVEVADELEARAFKRKRTLSQVAGEALAEAMGLELSGAAE